ncbi:(deoxy)nucleoside triphosphate pyrophosphohydrolase [soil metagenome]
MSEEKPAPPTTVVVVAAIIAREDGTILIAQRPPGGNLAGFWEYPGGKVEPGEDPRDALVRECQEELGCDVEVGAVYETIFHRTPTRSFLLLFYVARVIRCEPRPMEQNELAWVTPAAMRDYPILEPDAPLIAQFETRFPHFEQHAKP